MSNGRGAYSAALAAVFLLAGAATAQQPVKTIRPGMTIDEVKTEFGEPQGRSSAGDFTYYFYNNGCERLCGFPDLVVFQNGQVVDAVLRAPWHEYAGESSSPKGTVPRANRGGERLQVPGEVEGVEVRPREEAVPPPERRDTTAVKR